MQYVGHAFDPERTIRVYADGDGEIVLGSSGGGFSFTHYMTPAQARELVAALTEAADSAVTKKQEDERE